MKTNTEFSIRFWGVRGSHPVSGDCFNRFGGNTSCVEIQAGGYTLIFDAGTGIINLGRDLVRRSMEGGRPIHATLFFSHLHHDHTQGFPFFAPAFIPTTTMNIFVPDMYDQSADKILADVMASPMFPVSFQRMGSTKRLHNLNQNEIVVLGNSPNEISVQTASSFDPKEEIVTVRTMQSYGHPQGVMLYRVSWRGRSVVYATDTEGYVNGDQRVVNFSRNADILIHDAQYTDDHYIGKRAGAPPTQGYGHSTAAMACQTARAAKVGQLILFHHDPNYEDANLQGIEASARKHFPNTLAARQGQEIILRERASRPKPRGVVSVPQVTRKSEQVGEWASS